MNATADMKEKCRVILPEFRGAFVNLTKAVSMPGTNNPPQFSITALYSKKADLQIIKDAQNAAKTVKFGPDKSKWPKVASPVKDGDGDAGLNKKTKQRYEGFEGCYALRLSSGEDRRPGVVDKSGTEILDLSKCYPGAHYRAAVYCYVWEFPKNSGKYGMSFSLDHVQKLGDDKPFGGRKSAADTFTPMNAGESDDFSNEESSEEANSFL